MSFSFNEATPAQLAPLMEQVVSSMLVAKPGFDEVGKRILAPHACMKPQYDSITGELIGYTEDPREQAAEKHVA